MTTTSGNKLPESFGKPKFWHYIDHMRSTVAFEVETNLSTFLIEFDGMNDLPSFGRACSVTKVALSD